MIVLIIFINQDVSLNLSFNRKKVYFVSITNGHTTKFVMPSLITQTFPLDFDGYNKVIKNRPKSFGKF